MYQLATRYCKIELTKQGWFQHFGTSQNKIKIQFRPFNKKKKKIGFLKHVAKTKFFCLYADGFILAIANRYLRAIIYWETEEV